MAEKETFEETEKTKAKNNGLLVTCLVIVLMSACAVGGWLVGSANIAINHKSDCVKSEKSSSTNEAEKTTKETTEETTTENQKDCGPTENNNNVEKVYGWNKESITLFKSGNCVVVDEYEYTASCKYTLENNTLTITRKNAGAGDGSEKTYTYNITTDNNNEEYIVLSTNAEKKYKLFK